MFRNYSNGTCKYFLLNKNVKKKIEKQDLNEKNFGYFTIFR